jgi:hypothetical protein
MEMKILLATFVGSNRDFRAWLKAGMPANQFRRTQNEKTAREAAMKKTFGPSIA